METLILIIFNISYYLIPKSTKKYSIISFTIN